MFYNSLKFSRCETIFNVYMSTGMPDLFHTSKYGLNQPTKHSKSKFHTLEPCGIDMVMQYLFLKLMT